LRVMEPQFLTHNWEDNNFPQVDDTSYHASHQEWDDYDDSTPCYTFQQWAKHWKEIPLCRRPMGVIPGHLFTVVQPQLVRFPASQITDRSGGFYKQQIVTNIDMYDHIPFAEPLRDDLVHHSRVQIPLAPTGRPASLDMDYLFEVLMDGEGQYLSFNKKTNKRAFDTRKVVTTIGTSWPTPVLTTAHGPASSNASVSP
jgi:hypothetical protein